METKINRESNIELARIIAMAAIVLYHFVCWGLFPDTGMSLNELPEGGKGMVIIFTIFLMFGTNLFILISGYFGIHLTWKKVIAFWGLCTFYNLFQILVAKDLSVSSIAHCFLPSCTKNWFFQSYLWLLLVSPLLNSAIESMSKQTLKVVVIICTLLVCVSSWFLTNPTSFSGTCLQLFYMYIIGAFIKRSPQLLDNNKQTVLVYLASCVLGIVFLFVYTTRDTGMAFEHNSPFSIVSSVTMFCLFRNLKINNSKVINIIAAATPAVLFLSDVVFAKQVYGLVYQKCQNPSITSALIIAGTLISLFIAAIIVEKVRLTLFSGVNQKIATFFSEKTKAWK